MLIRVLLALAFSTVASVVRADTVFEFRASSSGATALGETGGRTGTFPVGLREDSAWADVTVNYSIETDPLGSGLEWLRAHIAAIRRGHVQFKHPVELPAASGFYRLTLTAGSGTSSRLQLTLGGQTAPYKTWWEKTLSLQPGRHTHTFDFELGDPPPSPALFLKLRQPGEVDIYAITLVRRTREQLAASLAADDGPATVNAFPWSEFPLGLPEGWNFTEAHGPYPRTATVSVGKATPRSTHPLLITAPADRAWRLTSAPIRIPSPVGTHTASAYVRATAAGRLAVICDGKELAGMPFLASAEPRRIEVPFTPEMLGRWHVLQWSGTGPAIIDGVQISTDKSAPAYSPARPATLALAAGRERANVFIADVDPSPTFEYALTGDAVGATLRLRVTDFYGQTTELPPVDIAAETMTGRLAVPLSEGRPYGSYRVEGALVRGDTAIAFPAEVVVHHVRQPRHWGRLAPESRFGNHFHPSPDHLHAAKAIGTNWHRFHGSNAKGTYWYGVEPRQGEWRWHDAYIDAYRDAHFSLVGVWFGTPGWARPHRPEGKGWLDNGWAPRNNAEFARYVAASIKHYGDKIDAWQVWNEPWGEFWFTEWRPELGGTKQWHPGAKPDADFAALSKAAWDAAHALDPDLPVLGINGTVGERGKNWMARLLRLGAAETCNVLTYHAYLGGDLRSIIDPESGRQRELRNRVFDPIARTPAAAKHPIWLTEGNWLQRETDTGLHHHVVLGQADSLDQVRENAVLLPVYHAQMFALGTEKVFSYALNGGTEYYRPTNPGQINWNALATHARQLHPSATAYSAMAWLLDPAKFLRRAQLDADTVALVFTDPDTSGHELAVLVGMNLTPRLSALGDTTTLDFLGNPARPDITHRLLYVRSATPIESLLR